MKLDWQHGIMLLGAMALPAQASAQSINPALDPHRGETRVSAAITIPLGHSKESARTAPRFEIVSRTRAPGSDLAIVARDDQRRWKERRIGLTLDSNKQLMIDGAPVQGPPEQASLDTVETALVVVGAVALSLGILALVVADDISSNDG